MTREICGHFIQSSRIPISFSGETAKLKFIQMCLEKKDICMCGRILELVFSKRKVVNQSIFGECALTDYSRDIFIPMQLLGKYLNKDGSSR